VPNDIPTCPSPKGGTTSPTEHQNTPCSDQREARHSTESRTVATGTRLPARGGRRYIPVWLRPGPLAFVVYVCKVAREGRWCGACLNCQPRFRWGLAARWAPSRSNVSWLAGGRMRRVAQRTLFPIREGLHASPEAWQKFIDRAKRDGVTAGQLFRALIYGYADGKDSLDLPPPQTKK
jgi:hypothetical protein